MVIVAPIFFVFWKVLKRTKWRAPHEVDLVWDAPLIDAYEASFITPPVGFWEVPSIRYSEPLLTSDAGPKCSSSSD
jgi:hypothetical protein